MDVSRKTMAADGGLPDECWETVFGFLSDGNHHYLESLSLVSKQFLSITNNLRSSLVICDLTLPLLPRLLHRFPNLTSIDLTQLQFHADLDALLRQISLFPLDLKSLHISKKSSVPRNGLQALTGKVKTLTSLTCSRMRFSWKKDILLISNCFPFLHELDLNFLSCTNHRIDFEVEALSLALPNLRKFNFSGNYMTDQSVFYLCKNCKFLEEIVMLNCHFISLLGIASAICERRSLRCLSVTISGAAQHFAKPSISSHFFASLMSLKDLICLDLSFSYVPNKVLYSLADVCLSLRGSLRRLVLHCCYGYSYAGIFCLLSKCQFFQHLDLQSAVFLNDTHIAELSLFLGDLISINISGCTKLTESALFVLVKNCLLLADIKMEDTNIGKTSFENSNSLIDFVVNHQVTSLHLKGNSWLRDESIKMLATVSPNLQLLDLSSCFGIFDGIGEVLRRSPRIRNLSLASSFGATFPDINFEVPKLEVLNLSQSGTNDEALYAISKSCCGLLQLNLKNCYGISEKGVRQVVEKCTKLREINLENCQNVAGNVVFMMVLSRPSLRKITAPPFFHPSDSEKELFLHHGCHVSYSWLFVKV